MRTYWEKHPVSEEVLDDFYRKISRVKADSIVELRRTFPTADRLGGCMVFNVGGNNYRVIAHVAFDLQIVWIRFVLSHAEYSQERWKTDC